ncbi:MAG: transglycosylase [Actinobacteria bacterium 69-20]|nr:GlsB/YeaQ/YmgE family stress response membrane protein [Actinomycetota bacterium]OJV23508.1 MAG: transglycosylase [Actinobacteria bacterium 69-20]
MSILSWVVFGALAGWVASLVVHDDRPRGCFTNIATGVLGALLGGFVYQLATRRPWTFTFDFTSFGVAVLGAIALILIISLVTHRK